MENSEAPDQATLEGAVWSGCALFAYANLSDTLLYEILRHLPYAENNFQKISLRNHLRHILSTFGHVNFDLQRLIDLHICAI